MFACRVLVGQYAKGESHYRQPPAKDAAGNLYDGCVNDVREPTIYIVFKSPQIYPEFLITYKKFPNHINIVQTDYARNLNLLLTPPKSELSIYPKPTLGLPSLSLLKESDQSLCTSPLSSNSDILLINTIPSLSDNTNQTGIPKVQQQTLTICNFTLDNESLEFEKSLDPFSGSSDKVKIFDTSPTCCLTEMESKTAMSASDCSSSDSLVSFNERSSKDSCKRFDVFDNACDVNQTDSVISAMAPNKPFSPTSGLTCTGKKFLTSTSGQGSTLPSKSTQDGLSSVKIPVSCHSHNQLSISSKPSLEDRRIHAWLSQNPDLMTTQRSQSSKQDSHKSAAHRELVTNFSHPLAKPSSTARARSHNPSSAISHSAKQISVLVKTSSSSADKQSYSDASLSSPSVSCYEAKPSDLSRAQERGREMARLQQEARQTYMEQKKEESKQKKCVMM